MKRFVYWATFFVLFFGATALFVHHERLHGNHPTRLEIFGFLMVFAVLALVQSAWGERDAVAMRNARLAEDHERAVKLTQEKYEVDLKAAQEAQPIRLLERKRPDGELEPVRAPLKAPRPLLDATLGKTSGKR